MKTANQKLNVSDVTNVTDVSDSSDVKVEKDPNTHELDTPLVRGKQSITHVTLRKPTSGELRGTSLSDLVNLDVAALQKVLPRISSPTLTDADVARMDPADLVQLGGIFSGFLMPTAVKLKLESLRVED